YEEAKYNAEAVNLSANHTRKNKIIVSKAIHPEYRGVIHVYGKGLGLEIVEIDHEQGITNLEQLEKELDENTASVVMQYPNFFGLIRSEERRVEKEWKGYIA